MEQGTTEKAIKQLSAATKGLQLTKAFVYPVLSWQQMVATFDPKVQLEYDAEANTEQQISGLQAQDPVAVNIHPLSSDSEAQDGLSATGLGSLSFKVSMGLKVDLSGSTNNQISQVVGLTLGQNRSNTIYRLKFLAFFSIVFHAIVGTLYLPGDLHGVHETYQRVVLIMTVVAPIVVAASSLLVCYWHASDPGSDERSNVITGLLIANFGMLGSPAAVYWAPTLGTGN